MTPAMDVSTIDGTAEREEAAPPEASFAPPRWPLSAGDGSGEDFWGEAQRSERQRYVRGVIDIVLVAACIAFVFANLYPRELLSAAVPSGGDMGAHVWGPAFLRDHLLPDLRLSGWTPDWYAGFPAYQFYMVIPSLLIVALDVGAFAGWAMLLPLAAAAGLAWWGTTRADGWTRRLAVVAAVLVAVLGVELPYGTAFKLVTVAGLLSLPAAAYAFGRLAAVAFPGPALLAVATVPFLFDRNFTIYGGNVASTLAGEFAFSISLSLCVVYLGVVIRGLRTGRHRALAAVLLALTGLCHLIPAFYALAATAVIVAFRLLEPAPGFVADWVADHRWRRPPRPAPDARLPEHLQSAHPTDPPNGSLPAPPPTPPRRGAGEVGVSAVRVAVSAVAWTLVGIPVALWRCLPVGRSTYLWLLAVLPVGGLVSAFWVLPFFWQRAFVNDMGWEKLPHAGESSWKYLIPRTPDLSQDIRWVLALALVGFVLSLVFRVRAGWLLAAFVVVAAVAFVLVPQGRLWNARLLPFYYLCLYLLAALGVAELGRTLAVLGARDPERPGVPVPAVTAVLALGAALVVVGLPLRTLPFGTTRADGSYRFLGLTNDRDDASFVRSWARWNYTGFEGKDSYAEYHDIVSTMGEVGEEHGCGRAFWEYDKDLNRYGTPMALMLLPHWTDGCIGSMEGLFFEASATTPFHFLTQVELSAEPSAAQRGMPYDGFDIDEGVQHLQLMGVRYYMALSAQAVAAARAHPDLTELTTSGPWAIFEVADSELVTPLANRPVVLDGVHDSHDEWVCGGKDERGHCAGQGPAVGWFTHPDRWDVFLASSGPDSWERVDPADPDPAAEPVPPVEVSDIEAGTNTISFAVDEPGTPVLVKASYFPNWRVSGADGPYRVAPNLMVVVPTDEHVELSYGREPVEWVGYAMTALGLGLVIWLVTRPPLPVVVPVRRRRPASL